MDKDCRIAVLISGRGSNMLALADAIREHAIARATLAVVVSDHADAPGLLSAAERGIEALAIERRARPRVEHEEEIVAALKEREIDLICLAGFMRLLSPRFIEHFRGRILNIHPSLLPAFSGIGAQRQALEHGVKWTGCTVHFVDETLDGGPIIAQQIVPVYDDDTEETLSARILVEEHRLYPATVARVVQRSHEIIGRRVVFTSQ